jgi:hypothetical protein
MARHDKGADVVFRFEFEEFYDGGFLVLDHLFHNPSMLDEELLLYIRLCLLNKLWDFSKTYNPEVYFWLLEKEEIDEELKQAV